MMGVNQTENCSAGRLSLMIARQSSHIFVTLLSAIDAIFLGVTELYAATDQARQLLESEDDAELRAMAREEVDTLAAALPRMEEEIKLLLIPEDPEDSKNVVLEIRGGTGGDEAALFAGDLARMYTRYCENKG